MSSELVLQLRACSCLSKLKSCSPIGGWRAAWGRQHDTTNLAAVQTGLASCSKPERAGRKTRGQLTRNHCLTSPGDSPRQIPLKLKRSKPVKNRLDRWKVIKSHPQMMRGFAVTIIFYQVLSQCLTLGDACVKIQTFIASISPPLSLKSSKIAEK